MWRVLSSPWAAAIWGTGVFLVVAFRSWFYLRLKSQFPNWQPVSATIVESWIRTYNDESGELVKEPVVKFAYSYQGADFVSDTPVLSSYRLGPQFVEQTEIVKRYKKGDIVTARLHPNYPQFCYLELGRFDFKSLALIVGGILAFGLGSYFLALVL